MSGERPLSSERHDWERRRLYLGGALVLLTLASPRGLAQPPAETPVAPPEVKRLLDQLGSPRYADREAATNTLAGDDSARPFLVGLAQSHDPEVAARARQILARQDQAHFRRYIRYGREGQVERMVEGLCSWPGPIDTAEFWQETRAVAMRLWEPLDASEKQARPNDFLKNAERAKGAPIFRRLAGHSMMHVRDGGFVSPGPLAIDGHLADATVISTGAISVEGGSASAILLTTEDFVSGDYDKSRVANLLVVSAGRVVLHRRVSNSLVIARGDIDLTGCLIDSGNHFATPGRIVGTDKLAAGSVFRVKSPPEKSLRLIRWFESSTVGFEAAVEREEIRVKEVASESEAGKAGLRAGDVITALDERPVEKTAEGFRKQLRHCSVQDGCYLTVRRDGMSKTLMLDFRSHNRK